MATFKALVQYKKADGTYNVKIRVTHLQRVHYIATSLFVTDADLTKSKKIKNVRVLEECERLVSTMRSRCNEKATVLSQLSLEEVVALSTSEGKEWRLDFPTFCFEHARRLREEGRGGTATLYEQAVKRLQKYIGRPAIDINEITVERLSGWYRYLQHEIPATAANYFRLLAHCFAEAKNIYNDEDAGIVRIPRSPFGRVRIEKAPRSEKKAVSASVIKALIDYSGKFRDTVDIFLLSFYLCGVNLADLYEMREPVEGFITYRRKKTRRRSEENSEVKLKLQPEALEIIEKYKGTGGLLLDLGPSVRKLNVKINYRLKVLAQTLGLPSLTYYSARHTWATIAVNECGVDKYTVHEALAHSTKGLGITDVYIKRDFTRIDIANRKVIDYVKSQKL